MIVPDFETRSHVKLPQCGSSVYARHPSTEVMCLAWSVSGGDVRLWTPGDPDPVDLFEAIASGMLVCPHNAMFERQIWRHVCHERMNWPDVPADQWRCSASVCSYLTLPRSLEGAGSAIGLPIQKDAEGHRLMMKLCKPRKQSKNNADEWFEDPQDLERLYQYCVRDVETQTLLSQTVGQLTPSELKVWQLDQKINLRGIPIDREGIQHAMAIVDDVRQSFRLEVQELTGGDVQSPQQRAKVLEWISRKGVELPDLTAETVATALEGSDLPPLVRDVLEVRQQAGKASTAKLNAFLNRCDEDGRVRGSLFYHGASTGRWAGAGIQPQNFPRGLNGWGQLEIGLVHELLPVREPKRLDLLLAHPIDCISTALRSFIKAEDGKRFLVCDFASIEARVLAWIAGQDDLTQVFRGGGDVYRVMAAETYDVELGVVTKQQRQIGKMAILGLGYAMGHKSFVTACRTMGGIVIEKKFARDVVKTYRTKNHRIRSFWTELQTAAVRAIETQQPHRVGRLEIDASPEWLTIRLPSGRRLHYREPEVVEVRATWTTGHFGTVSFDRVLTEKQLERILATYEDLDIEVDDVDSDSNGNAEIHIKRLPPESKMSFLRTNPPRYSMQELEAKYIPQIQFKNVNSLTRKWGLARTYGGKLCENVVQAIARDFLVEAMLRVEAAGYEIIMTVHDEVVAEVPYGFGSQADFNRIMKQVPTWGSGCPIDCDGFEAERYRK